MIHQVAVPIYRTVTKEVALLEREKFGNDNNPDHPNNILAEMAKTAIDELDSYFKDEYRIIDTFESSTQTTTYRTYVLYKDDKPPTAAANAGNAGILQLAHAITKKQTWSKTANQYFEYWKLELANGRFVNVFNHPDMSRNTYKLVQDAGWTDLWELFNLDDTYVLDTPIAVVVSDDKEWLKLEQITAFMEYTNYAPFTYTAESENEVQTDESENE